MADTAPGFGKDRALLQKKSLKDEVFELLYGRIVAGNYSPGEWLRQEEIASQLGVSHTPVREALDRLVSAGLAERVPYRGVRVPEMTHAEIVDAYMLRLLLESVAVRLATHNISPGGLAALQDILDQSKQLLTLDEMSTQRQLNKALHLSIAEASGNLLLHKLYEMAANMFPDWMLYEYLFRHPDLVQPSLEREYLEHKAILDAMAAGDPELAAGKAIEHIQRLGEEIVEFLGIPPELLEQKERQIGSL